MSQMSKIPRIEQSINYLNHPKKNSKERKKQNLTWFLGITLVEIWKVCTQARLRHTLEFSQYQHPGISERLLLRFPYTHTSLNRETSTTDQVHKLHVQSERCSSVSRVMPQQLTFSQCLASCNDQSLCAVDGKTSLRASYGKAGYDSWFSVFHFV